MLISIYITIFLQMCFYCRFNSLIPFFSFSYSPLTLYTPHFKPCFKHTTTTFYPFFLIFFLCSWFGFSPLLVFVTSTWLRGSYCMLGDLPGIPWINLLGQCSYTPLEDIVHDFQDQFQQSTQSDMIFYFLNIIRRE